MLLGLSIEFWLGTLVTVAAGIIAVLFTFPRRIRGRIAIGFTGSLGLVSEIAHEIPNLRISYKDGDLRGLISIVYGTLINTGDIDVGRSIITHFPTLALSKNAEWSEFTLGSIANGIDAEANTLSPREVRITWGLLKPGESIPFYALIKTVNLADIRDIIRGNGIEIGARIENISIGFERDIVDTPERVRRKVSDSLGVLAAISVLILFLVSIGTYILVREAASRVITYELKSHPNEIYIFESGGDEDTTFLRYPSMDSAIRLKNSDLLDVQISGLQPLISSRARLIARVVSGTIIVGFFLILWISLFRQILRTLKKYRSMNPSGTFRDIIGRKSRGANVD
jgi:hypothetical protein